MADFDVGEFEHDIARRQVANRAPAAELDAVMRGLIKIDDDDDIAIRWWASPGGRTPIRARRGPRGR
jgi:hypothetical protein